MFPFPAFRASNFHHLYRSPFVCVLAFSRFVLGSAAGACRCAGVSYPRRVARLLNSALALCAVGPVAGLSPLQRWSRLRRLSRVVCVIGLHLSSSSAFSGSFCGGLVLARLRFLVRALCFIAAGGSLCQPSGEKKALAGKNIRLMLFFPWRIAE